MSAVINLDKVINNSSQKFTPEDIYELINILFTIAFDNKWTQAIFMKYLDLVSQLIHFSKMNSNLMIIKSLESWNWIWVEKEYGKADKFLLAIHSIWDTFRYQEVKIYDLQEQISQILELTNFSYHSLSQSQPQLLVENDNYLINSVLQSGNNRIDEYFRVKELVHKLLFTLISHLHPSNISTEYNPLLKYSKDIFMHVLTDLKILVTREDSQFISLTFATSQDKIWKSLRILLILLENFSINFDEFEMEIQSVLSELLVILFITREEEAKEIENNAEEYDMLGIGSLTYYDTVKSVSTKLIILLQSHSNEEYKKLLSKIYHFWESFIKIGIRNLGIIEELVKKDWALSKFSSEQILESWLHIITLSPDYQWNNLLKENFDNLIKMHSKGEIPMKYRILWILKNKLHLFISEESQFNKILLVWENIILDCSNKFKSTAIGILTNLILHYKNFEHNYQVQLSNDFLSKIWIIFKSLIDSIESPWVENFITTIIKEKVWHEVYSDDLWEHIFKMIFEDLQQKQDNNYSLKSIRLFEVIKDLLKMDEIGLVRSKAEQIIPEFFNKISEEYPLHQPFISEQLLWICSILIKNINQSYSTTNLFQLNSWIIESLWSLETIYNQSKKITPEISETMKYFCQANIETFQEQKYIQILESFINIGFYEMKIN